MNRIFNLTAIVLISLSLIQFGLQVGFLFKGIEYIVSSLTIDDTYYYIQTAWNTKTLGFVTFDGINRTSGVQLLWFGIILLIALFVQTKTALLYATLITCFIMNVTCNLFIWKLAKILKRPVLSLIMASSWSMVYFPFGAYCTGMDNSLHALVFWCLVWQVTLFFLQLIDKKKPNLWGLTTVLIFNAWVRLDSGFLSAIFYIFCIGILFYSTQNLKTFLENYAKTVVFSMLFIIVGLIIQLTLFRLMDDSYFPVSALVKALWTDMTYRASFIKSWGLGIEMFERLIDGFATSIPKLFPMTFPSVFFRMQIFVGFILVIGIGVKLAKLSNSSQELLALRNVWYCLCSGLLFYHILIAILKIKFEAFYFWYRSPQYIFWGITFALFALMIEDTIRTRGFIRLSKRILPSFGFVMIILSFFGYTWKIRTIPDKNSMFLKHYYAALWMSENLPYNAICASWNAGIFGFYSNRTVINLDGLINSVFYYKNVLRDGSLSLTDYLNDRKVHYIADYVDNEITANLSIIYSSDKNDSSDYWSSRWVRVWQRLPPIDIHQ